MVTNVAQHMRDPPLDFVRAKARPTLVLLQHSHCFIGLQAENRRVSLTIRTMTSNVVYEVPVIQTVLSG